MSAARRRNEALLLLGVLILAAALYGLTRSGGGTRVQALVDGRERLSLPAGALGRYVVDGENGARNVIEITAEGARMAEANCPDQWCVRKGTVPPGADTIVCLPHRLIVRWAAEDKPGGAPDALDAPDVVIQ